MFDRHYSLIGVFLIDQIVNEDSKESILNFFFRIEWNSRIHCLID